MGPALLGNASRLLCIVPTRAAGIPTVRALGTAFRRLKGEGGGLRRFISVASTPWSKEVIPTKVNWITRSGGCPVPRGNMRHASPCTGVHQCTSAGDFFSNLTELLPTMGPKILQGNRLLQRCLEHDLPGVYRSVSWLSVLCSGTRAIYNFVQVQLGDGARCRPWFT